MKPEDTTPIEHQPIEHQNVPQAHQGLHDFLYSSADEHAVEVTPTPVQTQAIDSPVEINVWLDDVQNAKVAGVYAVLDCDRNTQFVSYSRNVALSLRGHLTQKGGAVCSKVTVHPFKFPKRAEMEALRDEWIAALPTPPSGNLDGTWASTIKAAATQAMTDTERKTYEEKKLKLRRAMADGTLQKDTAQVNHDLEQRQSLAAAMNDDNWSAVIREQTQETQPDPQ